MLKTVGGSVWSELKGRDSEKDLPLMDEGRIPDFFDHWMEEYTSKVAANHPHTGQQTPEYTERKEVDRKEPPAGGHLLQFNFINPLLTQFTHGQQTFFQLSS